MIECMACDCVCLLVLIVLLACTPSGCGGPSVVAWPESTSGEVCLVEVTGSGFQWSFRYPGGDGRFGTDDDLVSTGDLHLPRGTTVDLKLTSTDYIYTLRLPELELEEIAVPEFPSEVENLPDWFTDARSARRQSTRYRRQHDP